MEITLKLTIEQSRLIWESIRHNIDTTKDKIEIFEKDCDMDWEKNYLHELKELRKFLRKSINEHFENKKEQVED